MGVERWFERKASDLRGEAKIHLDRSHFSVVTRTNRPRVWPRRGIVVRVNLLTRLSGLRCERLECLQVQSEYSYSEKAREGAEAPRWSRENTREKRRCAV